MPFIVDELSKVLFASKLHDGYQLSFWNALIVAVMHKGRAIALLAEDPNLSQIIVGFVVGPSNDYVEPLTVGLWGGLLSSGELVSGASLL